MDRSRSRRRGARSFERGEIRVDHHADQTRRRRLRAATRAAFREPSWPGCRSGARLRPAGTTARDRRRRSSSQFRSTRLERGLCAEVPNRVCGLPRRDDEIFGIVGAGASSTSPARSPRRSPSRGAASRFPSRSSRAPALQLDPGDGVRDLARDELEAATGRLVIEQNPRDGEKAVALPVVHRDVVSVYFRDPVRDSGGRTASCSVCGDLAAPCRTSPTGGGLIETDRRAHLPDRLRALA